MQIWCILKGQKIVGWEEGDILRYRIVKKNVLAFPRNIHVSSILKVQGVCCKIILFYLLYCVLIANWKRKY